MDYTLNLLGMVLLAFCHGIYTEKPFRDLYTVGNTKCWGGHECDFHDWSYKWCYVDETANWDYCCGNECKKRGSSMHTLCNSGNKLLACTEPSFTAENGQTCIPEYPCGLHGDVRNALAFWCYVDEKRDREVKCCPPYTPFAADGCIM